MIFLSSFSTLSSFSPQLLLLWNSFNLVHLSAFTSDDVAAWVKFPRKSKLTHWCQNKSMLPNNTGLLETTCPVANFNVKNKYQKKLNDYFTLFLHLTLSYRVQAVVNEQGSGPICDVRGLKNIHFFTLKGLRYIKIYQRKSFDWTLKGKEPRDWASDVPKLQKKKTLFISCFSMPQSLVLKSRAESMKPRNLSVSLWLT